MQPKNPNQLPQLQMADFVRKRIIYARLYSRKCIIMQTEIRNTWCALFTWYFCKECGRRSYRAVLAGALQNRCISVFRPTRRKYAPEITNQLFRLVRNTAQLFIATVAGKSFTGSSADRHTVTTRAVSLKLLNLFSVRGIAEPVYDCLTAFARHGQTPNG